MPCSSLTPAAECIHDVRELLTEGLGAQPFAGHEVRVSYERRAKPVDAMAFVVEVKRVQSSARREGYSAKLDSSLAGDLQRVRGGADTIVMYEMVLPFAFLGKRVSIAVDERGRLQAVEGGAEIRQAMLDMHPPKPRKDPHYQKKVELTLSDEAIAELLMPGSVAIPKEGPLASGRQDTTEGATFDLVEYAGRGQEGFRISLRPERWLIEQKRAFIPVAEVSSRVPPLPNPIATVELMKGDRSLTVEYEPKNPCFRRAGSAYNDLAVWSGMIDDVKTTTERKRSITRIWEKK
jgi:hypothetical protein